MNTQNLPYPVQRYFERCLAPETIIESVTLKQEGELRLSTKSSHWMKFHAEHKALATTPQFVWNASVHMAPLINVGVTDQLVDGEGSGNVKLFSRWTVVRSKPSVEMNLGSLHRYLAESPWYPTALLPQHGVEWTPIDNNKARATLKVKDLSVNLEFRFLETGEISGIYTPERWGTFGGKFKKCAWEGCFSDYQMKDNFYIPRQGLVGWYDGGVLQPVWKGTITDLQFSNQD